MKKSEEEYLFNYIRYLQHKVNQLTIAVLTGDKSELEYPKAADVQPGEKIPLGHLADDLLGTCYEGKNACDKSNKRN